MESLRHHIESLPPLNLPAPAQLRLNTGSDGVQRVFDPLRGRFVALTPEEWVRRNFTEWLVTHLGYPAALMANEVAITLNNTPRRCDTVLFFPDGRRPRMIVEYKAPNIEITQRVFDQITRYNMVLQAPYLAVSNGLRHYCCHIDYASRHASFMEAFPPYSAL